VFESSENVADTAYIVGDFLLNPTATSVHYFWGTSKMTAVAVPRSVE